MEQPPRLWPGVTALHHDWLRSVAQLARLYRKNGQAQKAIAVENRLLKLLAVADADHPLLEELEAARLFFARPVLIALFLLDEALKR